MGEMKSPSKWTDSMTTSLSRSFTISASMIADYLSLNLPPHRIGGSLYVSINSIWQCSTQAKTSGSLVISFHAGTHCCNLPAWKQHPESLTSVKGYFGPICFASSPLDCACCMWGRALSSLTACRCLLLDLCICVQILWTWRAEAPVSLVFVGVHFGIASA